jgi:CRP-like cAMP-binding protein
MISLLAVMEAGNGVETATIGREGVVGVMVGFGGRSATGRAVIQLEGTIASIDAAFFERAIAQSASMRNLFARYNDAQITLVYQVAGCNDGLELLNADAARAEAVGFARDFMRMEPERRD